MNAGAHSLLSVRDLAVEFRVDDATSLRAVKGVTFEIPANGTVGLVGESGSGKSVTALAIMGLLPHNATVGPASTITWRGSDLLTLPGREMQRLRGREISMIFQEPMSSLNPVFSVGFQLREVLTRHMRLTGKQARARAVELLAEVGIAEAAAKVDAYPFELSGGQQQRVMIAMAIACEPQLLIADEPTTALDVTIQRQILELLADLRQRHHMSMLYISHDLATVGEVADRVVVMREGEIREQGAVAQVYEAPEDAYTQALLACRPRLDRRPARLPVIEDFLGRPEVKAGEQRLNVNLDPGVRQDDVASLRQDDVASLRQDDVAGPRQDDVAGLRQDDVASLRQDDVAGLRQDDVAKLPRNDSSGLRRDGARQVMPQRSRGLDGSEPIVLEARHLAKSFYRREGWFRKKETPAVRDASFRLPRGKTLGLVGESGCGKTTLARMLVRLQPATRGEVIFDGADLLAAPRATLEHKRRIQIVFQNPYASLNPRFTTGHILMEPMQLHGIGAGEGERRALAYEMLEKVGLPAEAFFKYPHEFSGGQRQRIAIARCLTLKPDVLICDEPVSALDVSVQAQLLNLLQDLQDQYGMSYLFISHDLAVVKYMADQILVMSEGEIVEVADSDEIYAAPRHPYTRKLLASMPGGWLPPAAPAQ